MRNDENACSKIFSKTKKHNLVEEPQDFSSNMFSSCLLMIHNPSTRRQNNIPNTSSWQKLIDPFLKIRKTDIESGGDDAAFIETTVELNDNLA